MVVAVLLSLAPAAIAGQAPAAAAKAWDPPRTPDGQPDLQGIWLAPLRSYDIEQDPRNSEEVNNVTREPGAPRTPLKSPIVDPADGKIPYQPWAAALAQFLHEQHTNPSKLEYLDTLARCFPGAPRLMYQGEFQILQSPGRVMILHEYLHAYRIIPTDGHPHVGANIRLWMGDSRGHWEGNTLVVDTTNSNGRTRLDVVNNFHSDALHVVERLTRTGPDTIDYEATLEDPKVFSRPWKIAFPLTRNTQPGFELLEHACHEGNRAVENIFRGGSSTKETLQDSR